MELLTEGTLYSASGRQPRDKAMQVQARIGYELSTLESNSNLTVV